VRDVKPLVAGILAGLAALFMLIGNVGHSWFKRSSGDRFEGLGLWSLMAQDEDESETVSFTKFEHPKDEVKRYIYTAMPFYVVNWLVIIALAGGALLGILKFTGKPLPPQAPLLCTMIPTAGGGGMFLIWLFGGTVGNDMLEHLEAGGSLYIWVLGEVLAIGAAVLLVLSHQAATAQAAGPRG
jgi:hypothetical protein